MGQILKLEKSREPLKFSGERYTTAAHGQIEIEHLHRYLLAREICKDRDVIDVASGEGYGTALLGQISKSAVGVEIDAESVAHANRSYSNPNVRFVTGNASNLPLSDRCCDVVVSFETLEHLEEQRSFLSEIRRVLRPGGVLILSTPDRDVYSAADRPVNPFHVCELTDAQFRSLLEEFFAYSSISRQRPFVGSVIAAESGKLDAGPLLSYERRDHSHIEREIGVPRAPYLIAIASDSPLPSFFSSSVYVEKASLDELATLDRFEYSIEIFEYGEGYSQDRSVTKHEEFGKQQTHVFVLPGYDGLGPLRLDPADCPGIIQLHRIVITSVASGEILWSASRSDEFRSLAVAGTAEPAINGDEFALISFGADPQLLIPILPKTDGPIEIAVTLQVDAGICSVARFCAEHMKRHESEGQEAAAKLEKLGENAKRLNEEISTLLSSSQLLNSRLSDLETQLEEMSRERDMMQTKLYLLEDVMANGEKNNTRSQELEQTLVELRVRHRELTAQYQTLETAMNGVLASQSWRVTAPLRAISRIFRKR